MNCRICLEEENDTKTLESNICGCKGTLAYIHKDCLNKLIETSKDPFRCAVCKLKYNQKIRREYQSKKSTISYIKLLFTILNIINVIIGLYVTINITIYALFYAPEHLDFTIVVIGNDNVGKTTFIETMKTGFKSKYNITYIELNWIPWSERSSKPDRLVICIKRFYNSVCYNHDITIFNLDNNSSQFLHMREYNFYIADISKVSDRLNRLLDTEIYTRIRKVNLEPELDRLGRVIPGLRIFI